MVWSNKAESDAFYCLGVESSADDLGIGIVSSKGKMMANVIDAYVPLEGGIHPRDASRHHVSVVGKVLESAFREAGISPYALSLIAFSQGPGLGPCLRTGATVARALSSYLGIPLIGVNHCVAHIEIAKLETRAHDPVTLYVSGGNTMISAFDSGRYRIFGETLDIALGNCLDVFAREIGLRQSDEEPYGAAVERLASNGKELVPLPYVVKGMDVSFSGLLTATTNLFRKAKHEPEDLCFSLQETAFSMVAEVTERAIAHTEKPEVLLTGGVAANKRLQSIIRCIADEHSVEFSTIPKELAVDNGAMVAWTGILAFNEGIVTPIDRSYVKLKWRLDEVEAPWVK